MIRHSLLPSQDKRAVAEMHTFDGDQRISALKIHQVSPGEFFLTGVLGADHHTIEDELRASGRWKSVEFDSELLQFIAYVSGWDTVVGIAVAVAETDIRLRST